MVFVKKLVVGVAEVSGAILAKLCCSLGASCLAFHSFLAGDAEAPYVSNFDFFAEFEIGASVGVRGGHWFGVGSCPSCSVSLGFRPSLRL